MADMGYVDNVYIKMVHFKKIFLEMEIYINIPASVSINTYRCSTSRPTLISIYTEQELSNKSDTAKKKIKRMLVSHWNTSHD